MEIKTVSWKEVTLHYADIEADSPDEAIEAVQTWGLPYSETVTDTSENDDYSATEIRS
jgi:hypothetical protein